MIQNSVNNSVGRQSRTSLLNPPPQTPPTQPSQSRMKSKLKNPFKTGQNKPTPPGPPGPPGPTASPVVINPLKKLPQSFLKRNQSLLFKSPKFSSTPIRPFTKPSMSTIPDKLFRNTEVSISLSSEHGKVSKTKDASLDEDIPVIVEEVERNSSTKVE